MPKNTKQSARGKKEMPITVTFTLPKGNTATIDINNALVQSGFQLYNPNTGLRKYTYWLYPLPTPRRKGRVSRLGSKKK